MSELWHLIPLSLSVGSCYVPPIKEKPLKIIGEMQRKRMFNERSSIMYGNMTNIIQSCLPNCDTLNGWKTVAIGKRVVAVWKVIYVCCSKIVLKDQRKHEGEFKLKSTKVLQSMFLCVAFQKAEKVSTKRDFNYCIK